MYLELKETNNKSSFYELTSFSYFKLNDEIYLKLNSSNRELNSMSLTDSSRIYIESNTEVIVLEFIFIF